MLQIWLAFFGGLIIGWLIEWIVDWQFWRKSVAALRAENAELRRQLHAAQAALAAFPSAAQPPATLSAGQPSDPPMGVGKPDKSPREGK